MLRSTISAGPPSHRTLSISEVDAKLAACGLGLVMQYQEVFEEDTQCGDSIQRTPSGFARDMPDNDETAEASFTRATGVQLKEMRKNASSFETGCCGTASDKKEGGDNVVGKKFCGGPVGDSVGEEDMEKSTGDRNAGDLVDDAIVSAASTVCNGTSGGEVDDGTVGVLYNVHFGGYGLSRLALTVYAMQIGMKDRNAVEALVLSRGTSLSRTDQVMVKIVEKMGGRAASDGFTSNSEIGVVRVAKKYENYVRISEYDGSETPWVDRKKYLLDQLRRVLAEEDTNCEGKVKVMRRLFDEEPFESDDDYDEYF